MAEYNKLLPEITALTRPFWEGTKRRVIMLPKCNACGKTFFYPRNYCPHCMSPDISWIKASGKGVVFAFSTVIQAPTEAYQVDVPYIVGIIDLTEGVKMMSNIVGCKPEDIYIEMPVEATFEDATEEVTLVKFKPAKQG